MDPVIQKAYQASKNGQSYAFATIINVTLKGTPRKSGAKMIVLSDGSLFGSIGGGKNEKTVIAECQKAIQLQKPKLLNLKNYGIKGQPICGGKMEVFIEPFMGTRHLVICGAGHIALPLSVLGKMLNFKVTIIDDRKLFASKKRFPHVDEVICANQAKTLKKMPVTQDTYIVIVTHGHNYDFDCLKEVVNSNAAYIGVISSKRKRDQFFKDLKALGVKNTALKKIRIPIGLDIGAQTPEEIALSICSEIVSEYNKEWLKTAKFKTKSNL